jgi:hypothetical protein
MVYDVEFISIIAYIDNERDFIANIIT